MKNTLDRNEYGFSDYMWDVQEEEVEIELINEKQKKSKTKYFCITIKGVFCCCFAF